MLNIVGLRAVTLSMARTRATTMTTMTTTRTTGSSTGALWAAAFSSPYRSYTDNPGAINSAGGTFSKKQKAQEEQYFRKKEAERMSHLKEELKQHYPHQKQKGEEGKGKEDQEPSQK